MDDRRTNPRNLCSDIVELFWEDEGGWPVRTHAVIEDISSDGACLQSEISIAYGTCLDIRMGESRFEGRVCYCTLVDHSYFMGVRFLPAIHWVPGVDDPLHLFGPLN